MNLAIKRIRAYLELAVIILIVAAVLLVIFKNRAHRADIWFFRYYEQVNVLWLILVTSVFSVAGWLVIRKVFKVVREVKEVRQSAKNQRILEEQRRKDQELADREKRLDEKIRRSIKEEP